MISIDPLFSVEGVYYAFLENRIELNEMLLVSSAVALPLEENILR